MPTTPEALEKYIANGNFKGIGPATAKKIVNTFGINGTVKVKPFTDEIERFEELKNVLIDKNNKLIKCEIENVKYQKQMVLLKFKGLDNINQVEQYILRMQYLFCV